MSDDTRLTPVRQALHAHQKSKRETNELLHVLHVSIVDALEAGVRQTDIVKATGYNRERIRQLHQLRKDGKL